MSYAAAVPHPLDGLPRVRREDLPRLRRWARALPSTGESIRDDLREWLNADLRTRSRALHVCEPGSLRAALREPLAAVVLASDVGCVVVELTPRLATWAADRILGGEGTATDGVLSNVERGAIAYAASRWVTGAWKVAGVVTTVEGMVQALGDDGGVVRGWDVDLGDVSGVVRAWIPNALSVRESTEAPRLSELQLNVSLDAGTSTLAGSELVKLQPGDVVLLDEVWWPGSCVGHVMGSMRTRWWCAPDGRCERIETGLVETPREGTRVEDEGITETMERIGDAPVFIAVELARFRMSVSELSKVRPGEVLGTGTKLGEHVALRVGDEIVARGELVDVEGELGVQITEVAKR